VLLALLLFKDYNTPSALQLLEKDQYEVLQAFRKDVADLFKAAECEDRKAELQRIGLVRRAFIIAGGLEDVHQLKFDPEYNAIDNLNLLGSLVGVTGSNRLRNFDLQAILSALHKSKAITNKYIDILDIAELMTLLPIGFQRGVRQRIREKLEEPRVVCSACGLGRIFSSICCKFLGKSSNRGYVAL
jgi:hypothetical protein